MILSWQSLRSLAGAPLAPATLPRVIVSTLKRVAGIVCLLLGIVALVTPLTPGSWLIFVGLEFLGLEFLLPHPIRTRWVTFKKDLLARWHGRTWFNPHRNDKAAKAKVSTPHAGGRGT